MAAFFANVQVLTDDREAVIAAVEQIMGRAGFVPEPESYGGDRGIYVGPADQGWVSVFDSSCTGISVGPLATLAQALSAQLQTVTMAWLVYDSALLIYMLFKNGEVEDRYVSHPDYLKPRDEDATEPAEPSPPLGGDGQRLLDAVGLPGDSSLITRWLRRPTPFAMETMRPVAVALGQRYADLGHEDLEADLLSDVQLEEETDFVRLDFVRDEAAGAHAG
jgi:hypothetical protein